MRRLRDRRLAEPFCSWIDRSKPLPVDVILLPRTINVSVDASSFFTTAPFCLILAGIVISVFRSILPDAGASEIAVFALFLFVLLGFPAWMAHRLWHSTGANREQAAGTLRQGILIGPAGVLVRLTPNRCYPVPLDRFVKVEKWSGGGSDGGEDYLRINTLDGPIDFVADHVIAEADDIYRAIAAARVKAGVGRQARVKS